MTFAEIRVSVRRLASRPATTLAAILTLSAGIGAASSMYLLASAATDTLPRVPAADRLARIWVTAGGERNARIPPSPAERRTWAASPLPGIAIAESIEADVTIGPGARAVGAQYVSSRFFEVLQAQPELGRTFTRGERAIVVSHRLWEELDPGSRRLGAALDVDGQSYHLAGVMPASFAFPLEGTDVWLAIDDAGTSQGFPYVVARIDPGMTVDHASSVLTPVVQHLRGPGFAARAVPLRTEAGVKSRAAFLMLAAPALVVLLAVCATIAALLLGDVIRRRRELALRAALGAGPWQLARDVFADAMVIAAAACLMSMAAAFWANRALRAAFANVSPAFAERIPSLASVWPMAIALSAVAVLGVGLLPAVSAARVRVAAELTGQGGVFSFRRGHYRFSDLVLIVQIAMSAGLILWASLIVQVFDGLRGVPGHVPAERVWTIDVSASRRAGGLTPARLLEHARAANGIESAGLLASAGPRDAWVATSDAGRSTSCGASEVHVAGDYFATFNFPRRGRLPAPGEAVLSEGALRRCGADASAIRRSTGTASPRAVVGTVDDRTFGDGLPASAATIYTTLDMPSAMAVWLVVRSRSVDARDVRILRESLARTFPNARFAEPALLAATIEERLGFGALLARLMSAFAAFCLLLGIVGLHAAITQALAARTRELGIHIALGAATRNVVSFTVGHHLVPAAIGVILGAALSAVGVMMLSTDDAALIQQLALRSLRSPAWWAAMSALLTAAVVLSAGAPVARALRIDPVHTLKEGAS